MSTTAKSTLPTTMMAVRVHEHGDSEKLVYEEVEVPSLQPGEVLVRNAVAGVNFIDTYHRSGIYPRELPFVVGREGAGEVVAVAEDGVESIALGDNVAYFGFPAYAQYTAVKADKCVAIPDSIDTKTAGAVLLQGLTAHYLATSSFEIKEGHTVLIHAGAGGTGGLLIQMAKIRGATVITTVSTEAKADVARGHGADHVINYTQEDFVQKVLEITDNKGCHAVYDAVGKATFDQSLECVGLRGSLVSFGQASGLVEPFVINRLAARSMTLIRPKLGDYISTREEFDQRCEELFAWIADGSVKVQVGNSYALADAKDAHDALEGRKTTGKVVFDFEM